ncbi:MAG: ABC transporter ATP-binding protein [Oscillospiraceae bacterium]|jgi:peptide/nickel transport system ATP-binding protein|nr:ABC transporter ATP-binding protein [Oscillospiraceae bacterium]
MYTKGLERRELKVISNLNINVRKGEILAVAGSSGSGKSLLAHAILGILPKNAVVEGDIRYLGEPLTKKRVAKLRGGEIALVPQSVEYLDPLMKVGRQVSPDESAVEKVFARYKLDKSVGKLFPFQLSGGMMRRVLCATAVISGAKLIIADEPTPGMSKELADRAMKHFRDLANEGAAVILITHDIDLALGYTDRIAVFYAGTTVETALASDFDSEDKLRHPYTKALWRAIPKNGFRPTEGTQPYAGSLPDGCLFAPRCELKGEKCACGAIEPRNIRGGEVCCHYAA